MGPPKTLKPPPTDTVKAKDRDGLGMNSQAHSHRIATMRPFDAGRETGA